ncbi:Uncharacterised protein [Streptococcus pneumoniae]|nr:Uncharacterised protein [Streptococcus pneumoniae]
MDGRALLTGPLHLLGQALGGTARGQRGEDRRVLVGGLPGLHGLGQGHQLGHEGVMDVRRDDHALVGVAGLAHVVHAGRPRGAGGLGRVLGVEHDVRVRPAELEDGLLEVLARERADHGAGPLGAGQGDAGHARVGDELGDLVVRGEDVGVHAGRHAGVVHDLLHGQGRARADLGVLEHDRVAEHEVRRGETGDLVVREVPRHDAQQHTQGQVADHGAAAPVGLDGAVRGEGGALVREVAEDGRAELRLLDALGHALAHLGGDDLRELVLALLEEVRDLLHDGGALLDGAGGPRTLGGLGGGQQLVDLTVGEGREGLHDLVGAGVLHAIAGGGAHEWVLSFGSRTTAVPSSSGRMIGMGRVESVCGRVSPRK